MGMLLSRHKVVAENVTTSAETSFEKEAEETKVEPKAEAEEKTYSKTEINRMSTKALQDLAKEIGIENADEISGSKIKPMIIEKLGL